MKKYYKKDVKSQNKNKSSNDLFFLLWYNRFGDINEN